MYDDYEIEYPMQSIYIAKIFYDHGRLDHLMKNLDDNVTISWDELGWIEIASVESVFADSRCYQQEGSRVMADTYEPDRVTYVLRDPLLTRYDDLCRKLERQTGITPVENLFARELESAINRNLQFNNYCYDYCWKDSTKDRKGAKIVLFLFEEFSTYYEVADALFTILDFCEAGIPRLEAALAEAKQKKVISLPIQAAPEQEAA